MKLSPFVTACVLAVTIDSCSNIIAQRLKAWNNNVPFVFDRTLFFHFMIFGAIGAPINFHWQMWLENTFPGMKRGRRNHDATLSTSEEKDGSMRLREEGRAGASEDDKEEQVWVRDWFNIFRKWFTDCITMGAIINTTLFLVVMGILKGKTMAVIGDDLVKEMWPIIWDSYKVWPIANFFSTTYVPAERRIVFLSCCGLLWNIYLSLVAARL